MKNILEKILEEIEEKAILVATSKEHYSQPQRGEFVEEVITIKNAEEIIRSHMSEVENGGWIPVKWRATTDEDGIDKEEYPLYIDCPMPNDGDEILITSKNRYVSEDTCYDDDGYYLDSGLDWVDDVKAWMPKPEGYRGE